MRLTGNGETGKRGNVQFGVLGTFERIVQGKRLDVGLAPKPRLLLMVLLAQAGRPVPMDALIDALWSGEPPASGRRNIQLYVHQLRAELGSDRISTGHLSYTFTAAEDVDAVRFERLARAGGAALGEGDAQAAHGHLRAAVDMWRGPAFGGFLDCEPIAQEAARLEQLRLATYERWAEVSVAIGRYDDVVDELPELVRQHPFRERLAAYLMTGLQGACRSAEALEVYQRTRTALRQQLGIEPGPLLQRLHRSVLLGE